LGSSTGGYNTTGLANAIETANIFNFMATAIANGGGKYGLFLSYEGAQGVPFALQYGINSFDNSYLLSQIDLISYDTGFVGRMGYVTDMWAGCAPAGSTYPVAGVSRYAQFGNIVVPWNGSSPQT
jgi:hypothetical protein